MRYLANNPIFAAGGDQGKLIDPHPSPQETQNTFSAIRSAHRLLKSRGAPNARVLVPYTRYPLNAGDPASPDGTQISVSELGPDTIAFIESQGDHGEVILTFTGPVPAMTVINIQTGAYSGGSATVTGDASVQLQATGAAFAAEPLDLVFLNGQSLERQSGLGMGDGAQWVSFVQLALSVQLFANDVLRIATPLPLPPPPPPPCPL